MISEALQSIRSTVRAWSPPETRSHPSNPSQDVLYAMSGGVSSESGVMVSESNADRISAVFSCVRVISETLGMLPWKLYRRVGDGKEQAVDHPLYRLVHNQPNPEIPSMVFRETLAAHCALRGNCYAEIEFNKAGRITALWPLLPHNMSPTRVNGRIAYDYQLGGETYRLSADRVLHIPGPGYDGIIGYSLVTKAREAMGISLAAEKYGATFYSRGARPTGVLTHPQVLGPKGRSNVKKGLVRSVSGLSNANRVLVLEEGMKWEQMGLSNEDSQFIETRKFQISEIARMFRVPLHMIAEMDRATFSNIEQQSIEFVMYCLLPWTTRFDQYGTMKLLLERERADYFVEHVISGLVRGDIKTRYEAYQIGRQNGWLCADDVRKMENLNPLPDGQGGDIYIVPMNHQPLKWITGDAPPEPTPGPTPSTRTQRSLTWDEHRQLEARDRLADTFRGLFQDAIQRAVVKENKAATAAVNKIWGARTSPKQEFDKWFEEFYANFAVYFRRTVAPAVHGYSRATWSQLAELMGVTLSQSEAFGLFVDQYLTGMTNRYVGSSRGQLLTLLKETPPEELNSAILARLAEWSENRASKMVEDELIRESGAVTLQAFREMGVTRKIWRANANACPFCRKLDGKTVALGESFVGASLSAQDENGNWLSMSFDGSKLHAPIHRGCQCHIVPEL